MAKRNILDLQFLSSDDAFDLIEGISEEQAVNSEVEGDSDAEDNIATYSTVSSASCSGTPNSFTVLRPLIANVPDIRNLRKRPSSTADETADFENDPFDSDDSVDDPHYVPLETETQEPTNQHLLHFSSSDFSSDEEIGLCPSSKSDKPTFTKNKCVPETFNQYHFSQPYGPTFDVNTESPMEIFQKFFGIDIMNHIVEQSNKYASQNGTELTMDIEELKAMIGILIIMGFHSLPTIKKYWSCDENFKVSRITNKITLKRFLKLMRFLHVNDNAVMPERNTPQFDKLYKIRPMLSHISNKFQQNFNPSRQMAVDESMVGFKGRSSLKQYMPMKPIKRGFKIWVLADSQCGYMLNFSVYEGKSKETEDGTSGERVVLRLANNYLRKGYCLYFDNYFSTYTLIQQLLANETFACGTFRSNRKNYPTEIMKIDKGMKPGDFDSASSGEISFCKWKDRGKKNVIIISSLHDPSVTCKISRTNKKGEKEELRCPKPVADYNVYMGGVDRFDQYMSYYNIAWKSRRWWMKIFYYMVESVICNAYICYKVTCNQKKQKPMSHLEFRSKLANELLTNYNSRKRSCTKVLRFPHSKLAKPSGRYVGVDNATRLDDVGKHLPVKGTIRRCAQCSTKTKVVRSTTLCKECNVALCITCFIPFHEN